MEISINKGSWLNLVDLLEYKGVPFWDMVEFPDIPISNNDSYLTLNQLNAKRIDLIAYDYYEDSDLWWVLLLANNIQYPNQLIEGVQIRIPAKATIDEILKPKT